MGREIKERAYVDEETLRRKGMATVRADRRMKKQKMNDSSQRRGDRILRRRTW
jgi:hypothetical protein